MIVRRYWAFAGALLVLVAVAGLATVMSRGGERLVVRAATRVAGESLRACLASGLGLGIWQGDARGMQAATPGLRVAISDKGAGRRVALFTAGGRALSNRESRALQSCLAAN